MDLYASRMAASELFFYLLQCLELLWHEQSVISSLAFSLKTCSTPQDQAGESDASILMKDLCTIRLDSFDLAGIPRRPRLHAPPVEPAQAEHWKLQKACALACRRGRMSWNDNDSTQDSRNLEKLRPLATCANTFLVLLVVDLQTSRERSSDFQICGILRAGIGDRVL